MDRSKNSWCSKSMTSESVDSPRNMYRHSANVGGQEIIHIEQFPDVHSRNPAACIQCPTFFIEFTCYIYNKFSLTLPITFGEQ